MDELSRIVKLVQTYSTTSTSLINFQDPNNLETRLFNLLKDNKVKSDEEAIVLLYGSKKKAASYRMLKSRVRKKLFNHIHFLNLPTSKFPATNVTRTQCLAMLLEAESLKTANELGAAEKKLDQVLTLAQENEVLDYAIIALEQKQWISQMLCEKRKYINNARKLDHYYKLQKDEREAIKLFQDLMIVVKTNFDVRSQMLDQFPEKIQRLGQLWDDTKSSKIFYYYHFLNVNYQELLGNYAVVSELVENAEKLVADKVVHPNWYNHRFNSYARFYALLQMKQYELGLQVAEKYLSYFDEGALNWFGFMENYILLAIHSQNYGLINNLLYRSFEGTNMMRLPTAQIERFELYRRYWMLIVRYYLDSESIVCTPQVSTELSVLPKDKEGHNIAIVVIQILEQLAETSFEEHDFVINKLKKYISKYLRGEKAERARLFLRFLILIFKEDASNLQKLRIKGGKLLNKLSNIPPPGEAFAEVEIIPYEHLGEIVFEILERRSKTSG